MVFPANYAGVNPVRYNSNHPYDIPVSFRDDFLDSVLQVAQMESVLRETVDIKDDIVGESTVVYTLDPLDLDEDTDRYGDTPLAEGTWNDRRLNLTHYEKAVLVPKTDNIFSAVDPENEYVKNLGGGAARKFDQVIADACFARVYRHKNNTAYIDWDPENNAEHKLIAFDNQGLTLEKILLAQQLMDDNDVPDDGNRYMMITPTDRTSLLKDAKLNSVDYVPEYVISNGGKLPEIYGFKLRVSKMIKDDQGNRYGTSGGTYNRCCAYHKMGIKLGIGQDAELDIDKRTDKKNARQIYIDMVAGAVRRHEKFVVEIQTLKNVGSFNLDA